MSNRDVSDSDVSDSDVSDSDVSDSVVSDGLISDSVVSDSVVSDSDGSDSGHGDVPGGGALRADVRVGPAGWSYPDWNGVVYPARRPRGFSELRFIAERFTCVEVNRTFYRDIDAATAERWVRTVEDLPRFEFTAKASRDLTHSADIDDASLARRAREVAASLAPLAESGRLAGVLLQFPWHFADGPASRSRLERLAAALDGLPLLVEVRHRSFLDAGPDGALPFLERLGLGFTNIDLPPSRTNPAVSSINTGPLGYFRLHGRNGRTWFDREAGRDAKYDYLYTPDELRELLAFVERVAARTRATWVIANNHFRGQAIANALQIATLLGQDVPSPDPELAAAYPFLPGAGSANAGGAHADVAEPAR